MLLVGFALGFRPSEPWYQVVAGLLLVLGFSYAFSWVSAFVGLSVKDPETAQSTGFIWVFPLTFVSSAFVPTDSMPGWLEAFANVNPVTLCVDATRALMIGDGDVAGPLLGSLAWLAVLLVVFIPLSARAFRKA
jgi:ABC-2 type transport system permease protein/oleandomycin transport system permease protein